MAKKVMGLGPRHQHRARQFDGVARFIFSDRFIQPNYSANLTELNGRLSTFTSQAQADG